MNTNLSTQLDFQEPIQLDRFQIVDVRTPTEFLHGHIKGARNIPFEKIDDWIQIILDWDCPVLVCADWECVSRRAFEKLVAKGVHAVDGGNWIRLEKQLGKVS